MYWVSELPQHSAVFDVNESVYAMVFAFLYFSSPGAVPLVYGEPLKITYASDAVHEYRLDPFLNPGLKQ
jgi:hypothetical protein